MSLLQTALRFVSTRVVWTFCRLARERIDFDLTAETSSVCRCSLLRALLLRLTPGETDLFSNFGPLVSEIDKVGVYIRHVMMVVEHLCDAIRGDRSHLSFDDVAVTRSSSHEGLGSPLSSKPFK